MRLKKNKKNARALNAYSVATLRSLHFVICIINGSIAHTFLLLLYINIYKTRVSACACVCVKFFMETTSDVKVEIIK